MDAGYFFAGVSKKVTGTRLVAKFLQIGTVSSMVIGGINAACRSDLNERCDKDLKSS